MRKFLSSFCYMKNGFSLMEMMIVLLVVAIIAAATAPMIAKKSARSGGGANGAISFLGMGENIGNNGNSALVLGGTANNNSKLFIGRGTHTRHIGFGDNDNNLIGMLNITNEHGIALGNAGNVPGQDAVEIGSNTSATGHDSVAIGNGANTGNYTNAVVVSTRNEGDGAGKKAGEYLTGSNEIVLGDAGTTVRIPGNCDFPNLRIGGQGTTTVIEGNLVVMGSTVLGGNQDSSVLIREFNPNKAFYRLDGCDGDHRWKTGTFYGTVNIGGQTLTSNAYLNNVLNVANNTDIREGGSSDRRLKNVGKLFTGGLEELKKLDFYNFTFKSDKNKTPQVGVMAQDLQKVFPNAVWEGSDKYLRIRWDEMFFAVINAVKELDTKITTAFEQIKANSDKISALEAKVDEQNKIIENQQKTIDELKKLEKRITKLEKKAEKKAQKDE